MYLNRDHEAMNALHERNVRKDPLCDPSIGNVRLHTSCVREGIRAAAGKGTY